MRRSASRGRPQIPRPFRQRRSPLSPAPLRDPGNPTPHPPPPGPVGNAGALSPLPPEGNRGIPRGPPTLRVDINNGPPLNRTTIRRGTPFHERCYRRHRFAGRHCRRAAGISEHLSRLLFPFTVPVLPLRGSSAEVPVRRLRSAIRRLDGGATEVAGTSMPGVRQSNAAAPRISEGDPVQVFEIPVLPQLPEVGEMGPIAARLHALPGSRHVCAHPLEYGALPSRGIESCPVRSVGESDPSAASSFRFSAPEHARPANQTAMNANPFKFHMIDKRTQSNRQIHRISMLRITEATETNVHSE